jgi:UDPglucose 6-dehydrogenase/UDP-N-acetyl-D-galactosamine dehydrogenase
MLKVCCVGLGYVGLPLAIELSKHYEVTGFDIDQKKISKYRELETSVRFTADPTEISGHDIFTVCVPTPVDSNKKSDLRAVLGAAEIVGKYGLTGKNQLVILESTVAPGTTEGPFASKLEKASGLVCGKDFMIGYSPEVINPADPEHTIDKLTKVVAGMDSETTERLADFYGRIAKTFKASSIKVAEASKITENCQRDVNIALMNELDQLYRAMGIDIKEVIKAASTKWNFIRMEPGLVGGHCIPVDPYYLIDEAHKVGYYPELLIAAREVNNSVPQSIADIVIEELRGKCTNVAIFGLTYKPNIDDTRESGSIELANLLKKRGYHIFGHDPMLTRERIESLGIRPFEGQKLDAAVITVAHSAYVIDGIPIKDDADTVVVDMKRLYKGNNRCVAL